MSYFPCRKPELSWIPQGANVRNPGQEICIQVVDGKAQSNQVQVTRVNGGREFVVDEGLVSGDVDCVKV